MRNALRRRWLKSAAALGLLGPAGISGLIQDALAKGDLPVMQGIQSLTGTVTVNGKPAKVGTPVKVGDRVVTGAKSSAVVVWVRTLICCVITQPLCSKNPKHYPAC